MDFSVPKRLWRKRLYSAVRYVTMMMRKKAAMKRLNFYPKRLRLYDRVLSGAMNDYQFSCSSTPVKGQSSTTSKWGCVRSLLGCIHNGEIRTLSLSLSFPRFSIENAPHYSSDHDHDHTNNNKKEVDREAEEFIAKFYEEMELQRQDSFLKWQEMLARGT